MAAFFFLLGLEIKRELVAGQLQDTRRRTLMFAVALGGMCFPAFIFYMINRSSPETLIGWGIPMATDTAFAVGILALLGNRVPKVLYSFIVAYAIIDDLGAILVIALFYTQDIVTQWLCVAVAITLGLGILNLIGVRHIAPYLFLGLLLWLAFLYSGLHSTLAGIVCAFVIPARPKHGSSWLVSRIGTLVNRIDKKHIHNEPIIESQKQFGLVHSIEEAAQESMTPLQRWEDKLDIPIALFVIPVFALANAGIEISPELIQKSLSQPLGLGIVLGLVVGKPLGIFLMSWLTVKIGWGELPLAMTNRHVIGVGMLGGMGFTMSVFISNLAFTGTQDILYEAKLAVILASLLAGSCGYLLLRYSPNADFKRE